VTRDTPRNRVDQVLVDAMAHKAVILMLELDRQRPPGANRNMLKVGDILNERAFRLQDVLAYAEKTRQMFYEPGHPALNEEPKWDASDVRDLLTDLIDLANGIEIEGTDPEHHAADPLPADTKPDRHRGTCFYCGSAIAYTSTDTWGAWFDGNSTDCPSFSSPAPHVPRKLS